MRSDRINRTGGETRHRSPRGNSCGESGSKNLTRTNNNFTTTKTRSSDHFVKNQLTNLQRKNKIKLKMQYHILDKNTQKTSSRPRPQKKSMYSESNLNPKLFCSSDKPRKQQLCTFGRHRSYYLRKKRWFATVMLKL